MKPLQALRGGATIAQMRREFGVTARALRYCEAQGLLSPIRSQQMRVYAHRDRVRLRLILKARQVGVSLRAIRELLDVHDKEGEAAQRAKALPQLKAQLAVLEAQRRELDIAVETLRAAWARPSPNAGAAGADPEAFQRQA